MFDMITSLTRDLPQVIAFMNRTPHEGAAMDAKLLVEGIGCSISVVITPHTIVLR